MLSIAVGFVLAINLNIVAPSPEQALVAPMADVPVVVEAPRAAWGIRPVIRDVRREVGLDIIARRGVTCAQYPERRCLTVHKGAYEWGEVGKYAYDGLNEYTIRLNTRAMAQYNGAFKQEAAAHEFGHFLGFAHHADNVGVMGVRWNSYDRHSPAEYRVLRSYYGGLS